MEPIHLRDGERVETFNTLPEAVEAAKNWYKDLASYKLPPWDYEIRDFNGLLGSIENYKGRLAKALGYGKDYHLKLQLNASQDTWS
jgi:hypothetical protein